MFALRRMRFTPKGDFGKDFPITKDICIGRDAKLNSICINLNSNGINIELQHAIIRREEDSRITIEDLDTECGTFVNGERIPPKERRVLHEEDMICFGGAPVHAGNKCLNPVLYRLVKTTTKRKREETAAIPLAQEHTKVIDETMKCTICMETFLDPVVLECEHMFCQDCNDNWMHARGSSRSCPECRAPVTLGAKRVRRLDTFIASVLEPLLPDEEKQRRFIRREVLLNKRKVTIKQEPKVFQCSRDEVLNMLMCIQRAREAILVNNSTQQAVAS